MFTEVVFFEKINKEITLLKLYNKRFKIWPTIILLTSILSVFIDISIKLVNLYENRYNFCCRAEIQIFLNQNFKQ